MWVKKNLIDPTASLNYCLGVSIVQLALGIASFYVYVVDTSKAAKLSPQCQLEAQSLATLGGWFKVVHILCFLTTFYREIFSSKTDLFGQFMRINEILCIPLYLACVLKSIDLLSTIIVRLETKDEYTNMFLNGSDTGVKKCLL